jgi:chemotaxis methyl-accepting protein methylase
MTQRDELIAFVSHRTGIEITRGGADRTLTSFAERRTRELAITLGQYLWLLRTDGGSELERLVNAITVGYTWFFRDPGQLAIVEAVLGSDVTRGRPVRIWVPACSTGEDAYSLALVATRLRRDVEILGTDLNSVSLERARRGSYREFSLRELDPRATCHFTKKHDGSLELSAAVRACVRFARHNLVERPPTPQDAAQWDLVLCRNVLIYFTREAALAVMDSLAGSLAPGGTLVLGASEVVFDAPPGLEARYVANRLAFYRPAETFDMKDSIPPSVDWLLPPATASAKRGVVSVFPFAEHGDATEGPSLPPVSPPPSFAAAPAPQDDEMRAGHALLDQGDASGARDMYLKVVERDRTRADAHMYAGVARYLCGEVDPAMRDLRAALFLDESLWPAAFYLALCHENSGHPEEALLAYHHVIRLEERGVKNLGSVFDAWRADLSEVARRRVAQARLEIALH